MSVVTLALVEAIRAAPTIIDAFSAAVDLNAITETHAKGNLDQSLDKLEDTTERIKAQADLDRAWMAARGKPDSGEDGGESGTSEPAPPTTSDDEPEQPSGPTPDSGGTNEAENGGAPLTDGGEVQPPV